MVLSHAILGKCVLNWIALKLKANKPIWAAKTLRHSAVAIYTTSRTKTRQPAQYEITEDPIVPPQI